MTFLNYLFLNIFSTTVKVNTSPFVSLVNSLDLLELGISASLCIVCVIRQPRLGLWKLYIEECTIIYWHNQVQPGSTSAYLAESAVSALLLFDFFVT